MPLTASGELSIIASSDLGGLGSNKGSPIFYNWVLPQLAQVLLPGFALLGLLALKPNRCAAAWLIWLPLGCVLALTLVLSTFLPRGTSFFLDVIVALALGVAAVWLLANSLRRQHRFLTFLCVLLALAGFSALAAVATQGAGLLTMESLQVGTILAVGVLASAVALILAGLICRKRYRPLGLYLWVLLLLACFWVVTAAPFFVIAVVSSAGRIPWSEFIISVLALAVGNFALLLPFLILSSVNPFFRDRVKALLQVAPEVPPPVPVAGATLNCDLNTQLQNLS